jgi:hypothetical protein
MVMESFSRRYSWRPEDSEGTMRQRDSGRLARDSGVHQGLFLVLISNRVFSGAAKNRTSVPGQSESGTGWCSVSVVLVLSNVRTEHEEVNT